MHFTIILFLLNLFIQNTLENNTCTSDYYCDNCEYCGASTNNFTSCFYYNMVCKYSYSKLSYSPFMKNSLINYYKTFSDLTTFCGKNEFKFENNNNEIIIFNSRNKTFLKDKYTHCHYSINIIGNITQRKLYLNFDLLKNSNSKEPRNLKFNSIIIYKTLDSTEEAISINEENVRSKNTWSVYLNNENGVEIFMDFLELNYKDPEEILEIKLINLQKKSSSSSSGDGATIGGVIGGIAGCIIIFAIIYCCCCRNKTETSSTNTTTTGNVTVVPALVAIKN